MMSRFKFLIIASLVILLNLTTIFAQNELTEIQKLRAENLKLRIQVAQLEAKLKEIELVTEGNKLLDEFRKQLHADEKDTFDWSTLKFSKSSQK